jgi:hypothetical protein
LGEEAARIVALLFNLEKLACGRFSDISSVVAGFAWRLSIGEIAKAISRRGFCRLCGG